MRELLIGDEIANQIRMTRSQHNGTFIIVEGVTDIRLYQRFMSSEHCWFIPAKGKEKAVGALRILDRDEFVGVLAIVDADFWRIEDGIFHSPNLFITDSHDIETMMLASPALEKILMEWGSENKIQEFVRQHGKDVRQILLEIGQPVGYLRLVSIEKNLSLKFEGIQFSKFIDRKTLELTVDQLITEVKNKSQRHTLDNTSIEQAIQDVSLSEDDPWNVCCGHDLIGILSFCLTRTLGSNQEQDVKPELLEKILRTAYEYAYFVETNLYKSLNCWEMSNPSFPILKEEI